MRNFKLFSKRQKYYSGPNTDHFDGSRFFNPWNPQIIPFFKVLYWKITSKRKHWPKQIDHQLFDIPPERVYGNQLRVSFVGHSTMLIQTQGLNIITDPIWSKRASPFKNIGPTRFSHPGISLDKLPPIDIILISHNHYDHLDIATIKKIWKKDLPKIITPLGNDAVIHAEAPAIHVDTLDWHQSIKVEDISIHLTPSQHWSARGFSDRNKALWGAFVISTQGGNIYFCGDSGYGDGQTFRKAQQDFGSFRFAMLPIGAYEPRWVMKYAHMNPEEAVLAFKDLGSTYATAMHYETFRLADEGLDDPRNELNAAFQKYDINPHRFHALKKGEAWFVPEIS